MSAAAQVGWRRRARRGMGDDAVDEFFSDTGAAGGDSGGGTSADTSSSTSSTGTNQWGAPVSVSQLQQQNKQGAFNNLQTPYPFYANIPFDNQDLYANPTKFLPSNDGQGTFVFYEPTGLPGSSGASGVGAGRAPSFALNNPAAAAPAVAGVGTSALGTVGSFLGQPIYSGSSITWGWALLAVAALFLFLRKDH
jgi:hypothetical protein